MAIKLNEAGIAAVVDKIEECVNASFPHNDPIDLLGPWVEAEFNVRGWDVGAILDQAVRAGNIGGIVDTGYHARVHRLQDRLIKDHSGK